MHVLSKESLSKLNGVHPQLARVVRRAIEITEQDFSVNMGVRTQAEQDALYAQGRTKPGKKVTWTRNSKHVKQSDGFGHAVDLVAYPVSWDAQKYITISKAMFQAAKELGVKIRWGYDWDGDGKIMEKGEYDGPHFELAA